MVEFVGASEEVGVHPNRQFVVQSSTLVAPTPQLHRLFSVHEPASNVASPIAEVNGVAPTISAPIAEVENFSPRAIGLTIDGQYSTVPPVESQSVGQPGIFESLCISPSP